MIYTKIQDYNIEKLRNLFTKYFGIKSKIGFLVLNLCCLLLDAATRFR